MANYCRAVTKSLRGTDPVFAKTSQNAHFLLSENERFGVVFMKTGSINSGTGVQFLKKYHAKGSASPEVGLRFC